MGPEAQVIARAMQRYGLVLADAGSPMFVSGASASGDATNNARLVWFDCPLRIQKPQRSDDS